MNTRLPLLASVLSGTSAIFHRPHRRRHLPHPLTKLAHALSAPLRAPLREARPEARLDRTPLAPESQRR